MHHPPATCRFVCGGQHRNYGLSDRNYGRTLFSCVFNCAMFNPPSEVKHGASHCPKGGRPSALYASSSHPRLQEYLVGGHEVRPISATRSNLRAAHYGVARLGYSRLDRTRGSSTLMQTMSPHGLPDHHEFAQGDSIVSSAEPTACEELGSASGAFAQRLCFSWRPFPGATRSAALHRPQRSEDGAPPQQPLSAPAHGTRD